MVMVPYAKSWYAYVKQWRNFDIEVKGQGQSSWMYATHCTMVIQSRAKQSMTLSKEIKAEAWTQIYVIHVTL